MIAIYLLMPKTSLNIYLFAAGMGMTWLATVPPTSGIVGKLYGVRYLGTLFGLTLVSHQTGAFLGAWLGGVAMAQHALVSVDLVCRHGAGTRRSAEQSADSRREAAAAVRGRRLSTRRIR